MKKILIVENEILESTSLRLTLSRNGYECRIVVSGEQALEMLHDYEPDIILMDIGLSGKLDGISTAGIIRQQSGKPIVFISDLDDAAVFKLAKGVIPQNYIKKPFKDDDLLRAVEIALCQSVPGPLSDMVTSLGQSVTDGVFVFCGNEYKKVQFSDILFLEADGMCTKMYCALNKCYTISLSSNNVVAQLAYPGIAKTHRSFYVNIHRIDSIQNDELIVDKKRVPLGKNFKADILSRVTKISQK